MMSFIEEKRRFSVTKWFYFGGLRKIAGRCIHIEHGCRLRK